MYDGMFSSYHINNRAYAHTRIRAYAHTHIRWRYTHSRIMCIHHAHTTNSHAYQTPNNKLTHTHTHMYIYYVCHARAQIRARAHLCEHMSRVHPLTYVVASFNTHTHTHTHTHTRAHTRINVHAPTIYTNAGTHAGSALRTFSHRCLRFGA